MPQFAAHAPCKVLVTASEAFAGLTKSAPEEVALRLRSQAFEGADLTVAIMPVDFHAIPRVVGELIDAVHPNIALGLGAEIGAAAIRLETTAVNFADFSIADNKGNFIRAKVPFPGRPHARAGRWPAASLAAHLRSSGIPALVSHHAGTHLCNLTYYATLQDLERTNPAALCGYVHLPLLPEQVADLISQRETTPDSAPPAIVELASMSLDLEIRALRQLIDALLRQIATAQAP